MFKTLNNLSRVEDDGCLIVLQRTPSAQHLGQAAYMSQHITIHYTDYYRPSVHLKQYIPWTDCSMESRATCLSLQHVITKTVRLYNY